METYTNKSFDGSRLMVSDFAFLFMLFIYIFALCSLFDFSLVPAIELPGMSIKATDFCIIYFVAYSFGASKTNFSVSFFVLIILFLLSTAYSLILFENRFSSVFRELRFLMSYVLFFCFVKYFDRINSHDKIINIFRFVGVLVSIMMLVQYKYGTHFLLMGGRVEYLETMNTVTTSITRVLPPGHSLVFYLLILSICRLFIGGANSIVLSVELILYLTATILTFNRTYWAGFAFSMGAVVLFFPSPLHKKMIISFIILVGIAGVFIANPNSKILNSVIERLETLVTLDKTISNDSSLVGRKYEYKEVWDQYMKSPLLGMGVGAVRSSMSYNDSLAGYTHNGYLWILWKFGVPGMLVFVVLICKLLKNIRHINSKLSGKSGYLCLASILFIILVYCISIVNPMFMQSYTIPFVCLSFAVAGSCMKKHVRET